MYCRVRAEGPGPLAVSAPTGSTLCVLDGRLTKEFHFDRVFMPDASQADVFAEVESLVQSAVDGHGVTLFSYGERGAGKSHTMLGSGLRGIHLEGPSSEHPGLAPRIFDSLFQRLQLAKTRHDSTSQVRCSILEIYCDQLVDLLSTSTDPGHDLHLRTTANGAVVVENAVAVLATSAANLDQLLKQAMTRRSVLGSRLNQVNRAHTVHLAIMLHVTLTHEPTGRVTESKFTLLDLAG